MGRRNLRNSSEYVMLRLTNTLTGTQEIFAPVDDSHVRMYTCGPTVHDYAHIGNFRTYVFEDVLRRHLRSKGWNLTHVMNITDVEDKIIRRSVELGVDINTYTKRFTQAFFEDCEKLRIERPEIIAPATEHIPEMIDLVQRLLDAGYAYPEGGSIYFRIAKFPTYGRLSRLDKRELKIGARVDADEYAKEEPRDFVLWKAPKDSGEPRWEAPFGAGRPGWHVECSAMAMRYLGSTLDIHCGAVDNIFPHHENEIAQSEAATGRTFVRFWIHGEHLLVNGEKMSKSKNNFFTLRDLLMDRGYDPLPIRYLLLSVQYRKQLNFTLEKVSEAQRALDRIKEFLFNLKEARLEPGDNLEISTDLEQAKAQFESGLDNDLNTAQALGAIFEFITRGYAALAKGSVQEDNRSAILNWFFNVVNKRLDILPPMEQLVPSDEGIEALIARRNEARNNRDFAQSDQIRQQLWDMGIVIEDTKDGTRWRRK
jgi:cysteinyl-tRNA synthetase